MATDEINKRNQFKELFEQNYSKLYYVALTFVKDEEDAHDIVSDFFASLWEQYDGVLLSISMDTYIEVCKGAV